MNKHTPGPWTVAAGSTGRYRAPTIIVTAPHPSGVDQTVATITGNNAGAANARLIAAAPALLENLGQLCELLESIGHDCTPAREAIKQATQGA